jgi:hypothetical protein
MFTSVNEADSIMKFERTDRGGVRLIYHEARCSRRTRYPDDAIIPDNENGNALDFRRAHPIATPRKTNSSPLVR